MKNAGSPLSKRNILIITAIMLLAGFLRWLQLGHASFFFDEFYNVWASKLSLRGMLREQLAGDHPPLYYLVARGWYSFSTGEVWTRSLSAIAGMASVAFIYLTGRELFSQRAGIWAAAFAAASPLMVWYARFNTYYSFLIALTMLSLWLLVRAAISESRGNWLAYTFAASGLLFTYYFGFALIAAGWLVYWIISKRRFVSRWLASQSVLMLAAGISYLLSRYAIAESHRFHIPGKREILGLIYELIVSPFILLAGQADSAINTSFTGVPKLHLLMFVAAALLLIIAYVYTERFKRLFRNPGMIVIAAFTFLLVFIPLTLNMVNGGNVSSRFFVWAAPGLFLIIAFINTSLPARIGAVTGALLIVLLAATSIWQIYSVSFGGDYRAIMSTISSRRSPGDRIIGFPEYSVEIAADYYLNPPIPVSGGIPSMQDSSAYFLPRGTKWGGYRSRYFLGSGPTPAVSGAALDGKLARETEGAKRLWLVEEEEFPIPEVEKNLGSHWTEAGRWNFSDTLLVLYDPRTG